MFRVLINGFSTGLLLQLAVGPVFFFILNLSLQRTVIDGLFSALAVTLVDYIYILFAVTGVGRLLENPKTRKILGVISSVVIIIFGVLILASSGVSSKLGSASGAENSDYLNSFVSAFLLTFSSPLTIVFWTGLFVAKAVENNYTKNELFVFGISAGLATFIFLGSSVILFSFFKTSIPPSLIIWLNKLVGILLISYGTMRGVKLMSCHI